MVLGCENTEKTADLQAFKGLLTLIVFFLRLQARASGNELIPVNPRGLWEILRNFAGMKQKYMVMVLLALIGAASLTSFHSYRATEQIVTSDMNQALALALAEQKTDVINSDTIQVFNSYLQLEQLKGQAVLAVDTRQRGFHCYAKCSTATIFSMSEQRPALALWTLAMLWAAFCFFYRQRKIPLLTGLQQYGGLNYSAREGRFFDAQGEHVRLTPMQQQLMEMFFRSDTHLLTKTEICDALWPKKEDASETLYTLIRRLKPIIEQHSDLRIESDRGRAYELKDK